MPATKCPECGSMECKEVEVITGWKDYTTPVREKGYKCLKCDWEWT
jgi:predicted nucleic-acid-binding Zn-ribbon protein